MNDFEEIKIYSVLCFIIFLLIWKYWRDGVFKENISKKLSEIIEKKNDISKELESLVIEIDENSKKIDFLSNYLKRLDQNAARLADNIQGEQAMSKAIEMARQGADHIEIIKETGLSNEEVEAILHSHKE
tara:strand:- start:273 stop:662 length:390 start_codon:yes stop_codon:yes gene_type:complete